MRSINGLLQAMKSDERRYTVEGDIVFAFTPAREDLTPQCFEILRNDIAFVDKKFPWKDTNHDGTEVTEMRYLGEARVTVHNFNPKEQHVFFRVVPCYDCLSKGQLHAYEKYLAKLAEEVFKIGSFKPTSVRSVFRVVSSTSFGK